MRTVSQYIISPYFKNHPSAYGRLDMGAMDPKCDNCNFEIHPLDDYRPERGELLYATKARFFRGKLNSNVLIAGIKDTYDP